MAVEKKPVFVLANHAFHTPHAKTAHGLVRGSERFDVLAVIDPAVAGQDAGTVLDGAPAGIPIFDSIRDGLSKIERQPQMAVIGVATHGGIIPEQVKAEIHVAIEAGMSIVNGLHEHLCEDTEISNKAKQHGVELIDIRKPLPKSELHFWSGEIFEVKAPRIAVLGTDCAIGKRTTTKLLVDACIEKSIQTEMIYTGQTGWMQGSEFGIILDTLLNDFVSGELEHAVVQCARRKNPQLILIEGQSSLRNLSGPCGSELILSAQAKGVVLQHAPGRKYLTGFEEQKLLMPDLMEELSLIQLYGAETLAITLNSEGLTASELNKEKDYLRNKLSIPVIDPLTDSMGVLVEQIENFLRKEK